MSIIQSLALIDTSDKGLFTRQRIQQGSNYPDNLAKAYAYLRKQKDAWERAGYENLKIVEELSK